MWSIKDGTIICTGKPNGYIVTEKEYGDYILKLNGASRRTARGQQRRAASRHRSGQGLAELR